MWPMNVERSSKSLVISEIQNKTTILYFKLAIIKKRQKITKNVGKNIEKLKSVFLAGENVKWCISALENRYFFRKLNRGAT